MPVKAHGSIFYTRGVWNGLRAAWMTHSMNLLYILSSTIHTLTLLLLRLCFTPHYTHRRRVTKHQVCRRVWLPNFTESSESWSIRSTLHLTTSTPIRQATASFQSYFINHPSSPSLVIRPHTKSLSATTSSEMSRFPSYLTAICNSFYALCSEPVPSTISPLRYHRVCAE